MDGPERETRTLYKGFSVKEVFLLFQPQGLHHDVPFQCRVFLHCWCGHQERHLEEYDLHCWAPNGNVRLLAPKISDQVKIKSHQRTHVFHCIRSNRRYGYYLIVRNSNFFSIVRNIRHISSRYHFYWKFISLVRTQTNVNDASIFILASFHSV